MCDNIFIYREYLLTYAAGTLLDHTPPPPPRPKRKHNSFFPDLDFLSKFTARELKIRVVGFMLKKLLTFFEMLIVPHALHCIDGCFFVFYLI